MGSVILTKIGIPPPSVPAPIMKNLVVFGFYPSANVVKLLFLLLVFIKKYFQFFRLGHIIELVDSSMNSKIIPGVKT